jgi:voltage-gated potassium channel
MLLATARLLRAITRTLADPATRGMALLALLTIAIGTSFYTFTEGWRVIDALYFSVVTLTTIGFGDVVPTTDLAKLFTVVYSLVGIGILASFVASIALTMSARDDRDGERKPRRRRRHDVPPDAETAGG